VNAVRAVLYEYGHVFPVGIVQLKQIAALVEDPDCKLPALVLAACRGRCMMAPLGEILECGHRTLPV
jgi:hypothetical protein